MNGYGDIYTKTYESESASCSVIFHSLQPHQAPLSMEFSGQEDEWVAIPFSRRSSWPRDRTQVSHIAGGFLTIWAIREAQAYIYIYEILLSHEKEGNSPTCDNKDGFQGHYAKWDKSDRERQISYHLNVETKKATFIKM